MSGKAPLSNLLLLSTVLSSCIILGCSKAEPAPAAVSTANQKLAKLENQAVGLMGQFQYDKAVTAYEMLLKQPKLSDTEKQKFTVDLAIALLNRRQDDDLQRAAKLFDQSTARDKDDLRAIYCRALLHFNDGNTDQAKQLFQSVSAADPQDSYATYYVGQCQFLDQEFEDALHSFQHAQQLDSYLRSAYYGAFQAAQRLKDRDLALKQLKQFQSLQQNPRARLAELKYTRMGPKAEVTASINLEKQLADKPEGPLFATASLLPIQSKDRLQWAFEPADSSCPSITVADIDGDGRSDLFLTNALKGEDSVAKNAVVIQTDGGFSLLPNHPLANVSSVNAALWGDFDNDGMTDVFLCRQGANQLWKNEGDGNWRDVSSDSKIPRDQQQTITGACFDVDHDGDLVYLLCNEDGPRQLLNNNRDGTFRSIAEELKIQGTQATRQLVLADFDADDDADLVFLNAEQPHEVLLNDRFWNYQPADSLQDFIEHDCLAVASADVDVNGQVELYSLTEEKVLQWVPNDEGVWQSKSLFSGPAVSKISPTKIALVDIDGDSQQEIVIRGSRGWQVFNLEGDLLHSYLTEENEGRLLATVIWHQSAGPAIVGLHEKTPPTIWKPGTGRYPFVWARFSGKTDKAAEMRSNASGIGVQGVARIGSRWTAIEPHVSDLSSGQSLQPMSIGVGEKKQIDFLRLLWPDGVSQTELSLQSGQLREIAETQRQAGSCPLGFGNLA